MLIFIYEGLFTLSKQVSVSSEFMSFYGRNTTKIEEAKQAESRLQNVPLPVGASGSAIVTGFKLDKSKDKKNPDGSTKEGTPYCEMTFNVIDNEAYQGKTLRKQWWFATSANMDAAGRFEMFLNDLERIGLPREIRTNYESPTEIGSYFLETPGLAFHFQIIENLRNTLDDGKEIRLTPMDQHVPQDDSIVPPSMMQAPKDPAAVAPVAVSLNFYDVKETVVASAPNPAAPAVALPTVGSSVKYLDMDWKVEEVFPDSKKLHLKNLDDPRMEKMVHVDMIG